MPETEANIFTPSLCHPLALLGVLILIYSLPSIPPLRGCMLGYWLTPAEAGSEVRSPKARHHPDKSLALPSSTLPSVFGFACAETRRRDKRQHIDKLAFITFFGGGEPHHKI